MKGCMKNETFLPPERNQLRKNLGVLCCKGKRQEWGEKYTDLTLNGI